MGATAAKVRRKGKSLDSQAPFPAEQHWESSVEQRDAGVQQLFVRNLAGRSVGVNTDLDQDVSCLACAFAARENLHRASQRNLRFTFGGRQLEPGVPLWKYGISKGSNIHALACPCPRSASSSSHGRVAHAWTEMQTACRPSSGSRADAEADPRGKDAVAANNESVAQLNKAAWVELPVTITTPFAEVEGLLGFPEKRWPSCKLSPHVLRKMIRVTDVLGVHTPRSESISDGSWRLCMRDLHPFPCVQPPLFADVWERLRATTARIEVYAPQEALLRDARALVNEDDEIDLGSVDSQLAGEMHVSVSLLRDAELAVDDVTVRFREKTGGAACKDEVCSVCLEPMLPGEMCRRLLCLHCLHAGCAMTLLPEVPSCPVCRCSIVPPGPAEQEPGSGLATPTGSAKGGAGLPGESSGSSADASESTPLLRAGDAEAASSRGMERGDEAAASAQ